MTRTLIVAVGPAAAERAARWSAGDAVVHIGDPHDYPTNDADTLGFDDAVVSGDIGDAAWMSAAFALAEGCLAAGGRITLVLADDDSEVVRALPGDVAARWRLVGMVIEHPATGVSFARAADVEADDTTDAFTHAQLVSYLYRHPDAVAALPDALVAGVQAGTAGDECQDEDEELAQARRELAAYRNSTLGRLTTRYWALRRRLRRG